MRQITADIWRQELNSGGEHLLLLTRTPQHWQIVLETASTDRHSILCSAFKRQLVALADGVVYRFANSNGRDAIVFPADTGMCEILLGINEPFLIGALLLTPAVEALGEPYVLSPFETRYLADNGHPHPFRPAAGAKRTRLCTDLHVHFAGCVKAPDLLRIGRAHDVRYPVWLLEEAGIHIDRAGELPLVEFSAELSGALQRSLAVPVDRQIAFLEMERIYRLRAPITKNAAAFIPLCRQIAEDYRRMGAKYVELSMSNIVEAERLRDVLKHIPEIEAQSGVQIRFLAAMSRHDDPEWDQDYIERVKQLARCRYIVGVDFMGHETNSTRDFAGTISALAQWADRARPGYVLRVHAGENPAYPENVRVALEAVAGCDVQLRIGHGLYGVDPNTLAELRRTGTIVEFNLNSNLALNNIQTSGEVPIRRYLDAGIAAVLGTDGYGIYQTSLELEARAALLSGLTERDFQTIAETEAAYLRRQAVREASGTEAPSDFAVPADVPNVYFTEHVMARGKEAKERRDRLLLERLAALNVPLLDEAATRELLRGKRCISFAGAWAKSWNAISAPNQKRVREELGKLIAELDPQKTVLIAGGTHFGVENVVHECANASAKCFTILGTLVRETPPDAIEPGTITHACLVGEKLYDKAAGLYRMMKEHGGLCLFVGGGNIVSDEIQTACNLRLRYLLMDGPEGASSLHAREQPERAFKTAGDVLKVLEAMRQWSSTEEPYWHLGVNPTVDIVLTRNHPRTGALEVLLIRRHDDAPTEPGKWAFPGGFQLTEAARGAPWQPGLETAREACVRELREETGLDLAALADRLIQVGDYEGGGRDPRDSPTAWSRSSVFALHLSDGFAALPVAGGDDAGDARWKALEPLPEDLAFDHRAILLRGLALLKGRDASHV